MPERPVPHPIVFRAVLGGIGLVQAINGLWALFAPRSFYDDFPPGRGGWVSDLPAYNEHLMRDVGSLFLATGVLLLVAAVRLERRLVGLSLVVWLLFAVPHTIYHLFNLEPYDTTDAIGNVVSLALTVLMPVALLLLLARRDATGAASGAAGGPPGGSRLRPVERSGNPVVRYTFRESRRRYGRVPAPVAVTAHNPTVLFGYGMFELATERTRRVDERTKLLAVTRAAQLAGCAWCMDFGSAESRAAGISDDDLRALHDHATSDRFSEAEKAALAYADAMTATPADVPEDVFEPVRAHFDEGQIVELTSVIALENYRARFNWALGIEGEGFSEGGYCVRREALVAGGPAAASSAHPS